MTPDQEISLLLNFVRTSDVVFVRNGKDHTPAEAVEHLEKKRKHFQDRIKTADDFIYLAATGSILGKEPYRIRRKDGTIMTSAEWLKGELKRLRETAPKPDNEAGAAKQGQT